MMILRLLVLKQHSDQTRFKFQQLIARNLSRFFHTSTTALAVEKSALAALRKKTGYTFTNCKRALEMHNNDLAKAEEWLRQQAQSLGWSKATKLEGRQTTQGLVAVAVNNNDGVLVEVNCETDFVARNVEFENMVREAAEVCLNYLKYSASSTSAITKIGLDSDKLRSLKANDGKSLAEKLALLIGNVGENATLKRALGVKVTNGVHLTGYAHPSGKSANNIHLGRIGGLVAIKNLNNQDNPHIEEIAKGLCQHVVGMSPKAIGKGEEKPAENKEEESNLINQEYLLDDTLTVKALLDLNQVEVLDFQRVECGEISNEAGEEPLESVETCQ